MNNRTKICIGVLIILITLTIWQFPQTYKILRRYITGQYFDTITVDEEAKSVEFSPRVAGRDPEVERMIKYLFLESDLDEIAESVQKYPQNEFFLFLLIRELHDADFIDPKISLKLTDNLIRLNPKNAQYRYLKAALLIKQPNLNHDKIWAEIDAGNQCPELYLSSAPYQKRIAEILQNENWHQMYVKLPDFYFYSVLREYLAEFYKSQIRNKQNESLPMYFRQSEAMAETLRQNASSCLHLLVAKGFSNYTNTMALRYTDRVEVTTEYAYHRIARSEAIFRKFMQLYKREKNQIDTLDLLFLIMVFLLIFLSSIFLSWLIVFIFTILRKQRSKAKLKIWEHVLFIFALVFYNSMLFYMLWDCLDVLKIGDFYFNLEEFFETDNSSNLASYLIASSLVAIFILLFIQMNPPLRRQKPTRRSDRPFFMFFIIFTTAAIICILFFAVQEKNISILLYLVPVTLICFLLALIPQAIAVFPMRILPERTRRPLHNRFVQILLLTTLSAGLTQLGIAHNLWLSYYLGAFVTIFFSVLIISTPLTEKCPSVFAGMIHFFSKSSLMRRSRSRMMKLLTPYLLILWVGIVIVQAKLGLNFKKYKIFENYIALLQPLPEANEQTYQSVLHELPYCHLKPSDLERFVHAKPIVDYDSGIDLDSKEHIFAGELINSIPDCSPESYQIIMNHLEDPNDKYVLLERAAWGDPNAKSPLIKIYEEYLSALKNHNPEIQRDVYGYSYSENAFRYDSICGRGEIIHALSCLSAPSENESRFRKWIDTIDWDNIYQHMPDYYYGPYEYFSNLQPETGSKVLQYYLEKTDYYDVGFKEDNFYLQESLRKFGNQKVAEQILKLLLQKIIQHDLSTERGMEYGYHNEDSPDNLLAYYCWDIARHLEPTSIPLLEEYVYQTEHGPRAFLVSQLNRFHYFWHPQTFQDLAHDPCWKVRLDMLLYLDSAKLQQACQDEEPIVRTVAQLLAKSLNPKPVTSDLQF